MNLSTQDQSTNPRVDKTQEHKKHGYLFNRSVDVDHLLHYLTTVAVLTKKHQPKKSCVYI